MVSGPMAEAGLGSGEALKAVVLNEKGKDCRTTRIRHPSHRRGQAGLRLALQAPWIARWAFPIIFGRERAATCHSRKQSPSACHRRLHGPPSFSIPVPRGWASSVHLPAPLSRVRAGMWAAARDQTRKSGASEGPSCPSSVGDRQWLLRQTALCPTEVDPTLDPNALSRD
jgi:hypothetical protein